MARRNLTTCLLAVGLAVLPGSIGWRMMSAASDAPRHSSKAPAADPALVERGAYLVRAMGCNDCHTPWKLGPRGPEPDMSRALTGHPADVVMPPPPRLPEGPWTWLGAATNTAFAGPWGVSYTANLTPDRLTGIGIWDEQLFIKTLRTGRHWGTSRPILPPMPWQNLAGLTDEDLSSIYTYLRSIKPIHNQVPEPTIAGM